MEQIYESDYSGQEVDAAVGAARSGIPQQITQINTRVTALEEDVDDLSGLPQQVATIGSNLDELDGELNGKKVSSEYTEGFYIKYADGTLVQDADWAVTGYIPINVSGESATVRIVFKAVGVEGLACATFYDSNKSRVSYWTSANYTDERTFELTRTDSKYMRCSFSLSNIEECKAYINGELVWDYTGRIADGLTYQEIKEKVNNIDNLQAQVTSNTANITRLQLSLPTMTSEDGFYICDKNGYVAFKVTPADGVKYIGQISYKSLE